MVTIELIASLSARIDSVMARAFRKALGLAPVWFEPPEGCIVSAGTYDDIAECFRNFGSPMDR